MMYYHNFDECSITGIEFTITYHIGTTIKDPLHV